MANRFIPFNQQHKVVEDFEQVDQGETSEAVHEKYQALAEALEQEMH
jgi:hypothetical protein